MFTALLYWSQRDFIGTAGEEQDLYIQYAQIQSFPHQSATFILHL